MSIGVSGWPAASSALSSTRGWKQSATPSKAKARSWNVVQPLASKTLSRTSSPPPTSSAPPQTKSERPPRVSGKARRDRQTDVDNQALGYAVLGLNHAAHGLDIAPRDRQPDSERSRPRIVLRAFSAGRKIALEDLVELRRRHPRPLVDDLDVSDVALLP